MTNAPIVLVFGCRQIYINRRAVAQAEMKSCEKHCQHSGFGFFGIEKIISSPQQLILEI
jgi:hypothetical protein